MLGVITSPTILFEKLNVPNIILSSSESIIEPKQNAIQIKGSNKVIIGDLDSNEYTSADFEAAFSHNENFKVNISYSDSINVRRSIEKEVRFDSSYFTGRKADTKQTGVWEYILWIVIILVIVYLIYKKIKPNKKR